MSRERYVLLGLAGPRAAWFRTLGHWATAAMLPAELVRCVSLEELRVRLASGRRFSALILDADLPGLDRDLIAEAAAADVTVLVVDGDTRRDWRSLGAAAVLAPQHSRDELVEVLHATAVSVGSATLDDEDVPSVSPSGHPGRLVAVLGPGGTGASTVAIALAQGLALGVRRRRGPRPESPAGAERRLPTVLLADLCRVADQAMLHDSRVVVPSIQEIVEAHRSSTPARPALLEQTFEVPARGYRLVLGLRRPRHWVALRPRALEAALDSLLGLAEVLVADVDADLEGEAESGSPEVEERNLLSRLAVGRAELVVAVGEPSMKGMHALVRLVGELLGFGAPPDRILPVLNQAPRRPRQRAELTAALAGLVSPGSGGSGVLPPLFLPRRPVDAALRDGVPLPSPLPELVVGATTAALEHVESGGGNAPLAIPRVRPGTLTGFTAQEPS